MASRHHTVLQVFVSDKEGHDLTLIGEITQVFTNGKELTAQFVAHLLVDSESHAAGSPRLSLMQVFAVGVLLSFEMLHHERHAKNCGACLTYIGL